MWGLAGAKVQVRKTIYILRDVELALAAYGDKYGKERGGDRGYCEKRGRVGRPHPRNS